MKFSISIFFSILSFKVMRLAYKRVIIMKVIKQINILIVIAVCIILWDLLLPLPGSNKMVSNHG